MSGREEKRKKKYKIYYTKYANFCLTFLRKVVHIPYPNHIFFNMNRECNFSIFETIPQFKSQNKNALPFGHLFFHLLAY